MHVLLFHRKLNAKLLFQNAFHGPLHKFGKLMFRQMKNGQDSDRITREEFVQAGTEIVCMVNVSAQRKYYFKLFSSGKEYMSSDGWCFSEALPLEDKVEVIWSDFSSALCVCELKKKLVTFFNAEIKKIIQIVLPKTFLV